MMCLFCGIIRVYTYHFSISDIGWDMEIYRYRNEFEIEHFQALLFSVIRFLNSIYYKGGSRVKNLCKVRVLNFLIRYFSNYYTLQRSDLAARVAPLDPRLEKNTTFWYSSFYVYSILYKEFEVEKKWMNK